MFKDWIRMWIFGSCTEFGDQVSAEGLASFDVRLCNLLTCVSALCDFRDAAVFPTHLLVSVKTLRKHTPEIPASGKTCFSESISFLTTATVIQVTEGVVQFICRSCVVSALNARFLLGLAHHH